MKKTVYVDVKAIKANNSEKSRRTGPIFVDNLEDERQRAFELEIQGPCRVIYKSDPDHPHPGGARVWIETESEIKIVEG